MLPSRRACRPTQMALHPRGHSFDVPRVVYELTKRSFIMRSLHKDKSAILQFPLSLVICFKYASTTVGMVLDALLVVVVLVCLFVCFVIASHCQITAYVGDNKLILILFILFYIWMRTIQQSSAHKDKQLDNDCSQDPKVSPLTACF